jgi:hypothetical protein
MREDADILTWEDALECVRWHFTEPDGLLAHIERGGEIDETQVQMIGTAFQVMQAAWQEQERVPKQAVQLVRHASNAIPRLEQRMQLYPQRQAELVRLLEQVSEWTEKVFSLPSLSEEAALVLVYEHLLGTRPFNTELILGRIDQDALGELLGALEALAQVWQTREQVSKLAAYTMISDSWLFDRAANLFPGTKQQRFQEVEQQVSERITRCLS